METAVYSDDAKRMSDEVTMHAVLGHYGKWAAFRLSDGSSPDHMAYDSRAEAVRHQKQVNDKCLFILIPPDGMPARDAEELLDFWRKAYDAGFRATDPEILMPLSPADRRRQIKAIKRS